MSAHDPKQTSGRTFWPRRSLIPSARKPERKVYLALEINGAC